MTVSHFCNIFPKESIVIKKSSGKLRAKFWGTGWNLVSKGFTFFCPFGNAPWSTDWARLSDGEAMFSFSSFGFNLLEFTCSTCALKLIKWFRILFPLFQNDGQSWRRKNVDSRSFEKLQSIQRLGSFQFSKHSTTFGALNVRLILYFY